jgi:dipeptidyl aminopeptidase/acylaminoacyl peptidase
LRMGCLWVSALVAMLPAGLAAQGLREVAFNPTPVSLPKSSEGTSRLVTSNDLLGLRETHGLSISPDGKWVAFVVGQADSETNSYRSGLFVVRTSGKKPPICLGSAGVPHWTPINEWDVEKPQWSRDSQRIFYRMKLRPDELWQVWQWNLDGGARPLTHVRGDVVKYELNSTGQKIVMKVGSPTSRKTERELLDRGILYDETMRPWEGMPPLLANLAQSKKSSEIWVHELEANVERRATDGEKRAFEPDTKEFQRKFDSDAGTGAKKCEVRSVSLAPDNGHSVIFCSYDEHDPSGIIRWRVFLTTIEGEGRMELAPESTRITDYWWSGDGRFFYFVSSLGDGHPGKMRAVDVASGQVREFYRSEEVLGDFSMDAAGRQIACTRETSTSPPRVAVIDQNDGTLRTLVDLNPEFHRIRLSPAERISGVNRYGEEWFGHVVKPDGYEAGKRYPLIVTLYRSGDYFLLGATGNEYPIQAFAARGFVVLSFDIGRHRLRKAGNFEDYLIDWASPTASLEMAVQSLIDGGIVDPANVGLTGLSHGAEIVEYTVSHSRAFRAAIESGPAARDPYFYSMGGGKWHELFAKWGLPGWPEGESKRNWEKLAASFNAERINTALLMNSADSEFIACMSLYTALELLHKPVELYIYANELHIKNQPKHRYEIYERNIDWFRFWLKGEKDSSPEKRDQYLRWDKLRELRPEQRAQTPNGVRSNALARTWPSRMACRQKWKRRFL